MSTTVKLFTSAQSGAPVLSGSAGAMIAVLDACLVNGFGLKTVDSLSVVGGVATATISTGHSAIAQSVVLVAGASPAGLNGEKKVLSVVGNTLTYDATGIADQTATGTITIKQAPAGWEKAFSGTNLAAYRSPNVASTRAYFRLDDTGTTVARIRGFETMSDINTGTGLFPTDGQMSGGGALGKSDTANTSARDWIVIANDSAAYIFVRPNTSATYGFTGGAFFGDIKSRKSGDAYRACVRPNYAATYAAPATDQGVMWLIQASGTRAFLAREFTAIGGSAIVGSSAPSFNFSGQFSSGQGSAQYPNGPDYGLLISPIYLVETSLAVRGEYPGAYVSSQNIAGQLCPSSSNTTLISDVPDLPGRTLLAIPVYGSSNWGPGFVDLTGPWGN